MSCSTNTKPQKAVVKPVVKYQVKAKKIDQSKAIEKLALELKKQNLKKAAIAKARQQAKIRKQNELAKRKRIAMHKAKRRFAARKPVRRIAKKKAYRAPKQNIRYASLRGDYAHNPQTISFINMMSSKYGFDRGYLNYLFSNTKSTSFLKRMARADAYGSRKSGRKSRPGRWTRYRNNFLTEKTISKGVQFWRANRVALQRAEDRYGVPQEYILGIIGVETRYGGNVGKNRAIDALSAMGFNNPRRGKYFRKELESYLLMTRRTGLDPLQPMASYAGALGLCQFMPSNIKRYGVDFDGRGGINLWTPQDAIGSVANYFNKHGWRRGGTVAVPAMASNRKYRTMKTGFKSKHSLSRLRNRGVTASNLGTISGKASLIKLSTYDGDELWIGGKNFYVITRYNHSSRYAMAVHQLAQAIKGRIGGRGVIRQASLDTHSSRSRILQ
ncbi:MAG TPA: lytic murein transglycosylase B [Leucothrix sp.]|nr:lytic murein transglycosylase B [Leucothrix sp.]